MKMDKENIEPLENLLDDLRDIDGFPIAEDKDILELSDPPYYTACPNPYIKDFIEEHGTPYDPETDDYERMPFVGDVSEGKYSPIYRAHSYHTKVPYEAIIKFIAHYTEPGDIVFDGFCGSGMTGVAAQKLARKSILSDLSSASTYLAYNYTRSINIDSFKKDAIRVLEEVENECSWMYKTTHVVQDEDLNACRQGKLFDKNVEKGIINYIVWSDVFICPYCSKEYIFWSNAVDKNKVLKKYKCSNCEADLTKRESSKAFETIYDSSINKNINKVKQVPVLINYSFRGERYYKQPDKEDLKIINKINDSEIPYWYPNERMPEGTESRRNDKYGMTHTHHFFIKRSLWILSTLYKKIKESSNNRLLWLLTAIMEGSSKLNRERPGGLPSKLTGTLYVSSLIREINIISFFERKIDRFISANYKKKSKTYLGVNSITDYQIIHANTIDYIFTDPPFGSNLMYSELNYMWESWLKIHTNNKREAIVNSAQNKDLHDYTILMTEGFKEMYRILKPNRWITIVFHNSKASVWNSIQESITRAGFIIAQVSTLDKKQGSFKQVTSAGAVKNDLIINAYKPKKDFEDRFLKNAGEGMEVDFVQQQLDHLPIGPNIERTENMLFSKMLAHYVENGFKIKYNANNFYTLLHDNFIERDGYWFLEDQADEYTNWKSSLKLDELEDIKKGSQVLFVVDEKSALTWIYNFLDEPKDYGEIYTNYEQIATRTDDEIPELREMLDNNFVQEDGKYRRPQSKQERAKIEKNRQSELNRAWKDLLDRAKNGKRKIKNVRKEALVHGFTKCYQEENYQDIITVADRLYASTLETSGEILDFVDIARMKLAD